MSISGDSKKVLQALYERLDKQSATLILNRLPLKPIANNLNMSYEYLNLCLGYLNDKGLIKCDPMLFSSTSEKDITIKASGIDLVEGIV